MSKTKFNKLPTEEVAKLSPEDQVKYFAALAAEFDKLTEDNTSLNSAVKTLEEGRDELSNKIKGLIADNKVLSDTATELKTTVDELTEALNNSEVKLGSGKPIIKHNKKEFRITAKWFVYKGARTSIDVLLDAKNPNRNEIIDYLLEKKSGLLVEVSE